LTYDRVCFYQVLEHIFDVNSFIKAALNLLNKGGYLIISVPNNSSVFFRKKNNVYLNMPPHHMGLWSKSSLIHLSKIFPLYMEEINYEPIQEYHFEWFKSIIKNGVTKTKIPFLNRWVGNPRVLTSVTSLLRTFYRGHSMMVVYRKT
jgi:SAM-dependent methyltransferase